LSQSAYRVSPANNQRHDIRGTTIGSCLVGQAVEPINIAFDLKYLKNTWTDQDKVGSYISMLQRQLLS
jgi:hypothetical protein